MSIDEKLNDAVEEAVEKAEKAAEEAKDKAEAAVEKVKEKNEELEEAVENAQEEAEEKAEEVTEDIKEKAEEIKEDAEEKAEDVKEDIEEKAEDVKEEVEEKAEDVKEDIEEKKSAKQLRKEEKAQKKAEKAAAEAKAAAKKTVSTKAVAIITLAICAVAIIGLVMYLNQGEKSLYEQIKNYDEYVKLGEYKGLEYTEEDINVTKKEIKAEIDNRLSAKATTKESKKGTVKDGDNVNIDYVGKIDGKEFDGGSAEGYVLTIGSGSFIDGFEEGLIGKKIGDKVTLDLKFPDDYSNEDVAGKDVTFEVKINSKQVTKTPEYNEDFIKENSDYDNKKDYEASVKEDLIKSKTETAESTAKQTLWSQAVENAEVKKYPEGAVDQEQQAIIEQYKLMAQNYNMEWDDFLETYMQTTDEEFTEQAKTYGESVAKQKLVLYAIADKENLKVSNKDYKDRLSKMLKDAGMTEDDFKEQYNMTIEEYAEQNDFKASFLSEQVNDFIYKNAKATAPKAEDAEDKDE